jgi:hypothetical protein
MSDTLGTACTRDARLENYAAELTRAAYPLMLRHGMRGSWIEVELGLWRALAETVRRWARQRPPAGSPDELKVWRQGLLVELTESAIDVAVEYGIKGARLEVEVGLYRTLRLAVRRHTIRSPE